MYWHFFHDFLTCNLIWWAQKRQRSLKMPSFKEQKNPKRQPHNHGCFSCIFGFFFLNFFVFSPCFSLFPAVSSHLGTPNSPPNEVTSDVLTWPLSAGPFPRESLFFLSPCQACKVERILDMSILCLFWWVNYNLLEVPRVRLSISGVWNPEQIRLDCFRDCRTA